MELRTVCFMSCLFSEKRWTGYKVTITLCEVLNEHIVISAGSAVSEQNVLTRHASTDFYFLSNDPHNET